MCFFSCEAVIKNLIHMPIVCTQLILLHLWGPLLTWNFSLLQLVKHQLTHRRDFVLWSVVLNTVRGWDLHKSNQNSWPTGRVRWCGYCSYWRVWAKIFGLCLCVCVSPTGWMYGRDDGKCSNQVTSLSLLCTDIQAELRGHMRHD